MERPRSSTPCGRAGYRPSDDLQTRPPTTTKISGFTRILSDYEQRVTIYLNRFRELYGDGKVGTDNALVLGQQKLVKWRSYHGSPRRLTSLMLVGAFGEQNWLKLDPDQASLLAWSAANYDLLCSHTDIIGEICFNSPIHDLDTGVTRQQIHFALDTSSSFSLNNLLSGLTRSTADNKTNLPFGFTYPEYVLDRDQPLGSVMMPRYCVSVGYLCAAKIHSLVLTDGGTAQTPFSYSAPLALICRYRTLLLMWLQNQLYQTMLPEPEHYGRQAPMLREAETILDQMDGYLHSALDQTIAEISNGSLMPSTLRNDLLKLQRQRQFSSARNLVKDWQLQQAHAQFQEILAERQGYLHPGPNDDDTFVQLVKLNKWLLSAAYAGRLEKYRAPQPRNQSLPLWEIDE